MPSHARMTPLRPPKSPAVVGSADGAPSGSADGAPSDMGYVEVSVAVTDFSLLKRLGIIGFSGLGFGGHDAANMGSPMRSKRIMLPNE